MPRARKAAKRKQGTSAPKTTVRHRRGRQIAQSVSVVSSIPVTPAFKQTFEAALNPAGAPVINPTYFPNLGFGQGLVNQIKSVKSGIIVTLGGLVSFSAANKNSSMPFVSLLGGTPYMGGQPFPTPGTGQFYGCVSLDIFAADLQRVAYLGQPPQPPRLGGPYTPQQICLLYDSRTPMADAELNQWPGATPVEAHTTADITKAFQSTINVPAVIVSASPFYHQSMETLIQAANNSGKYVCYPLDNYRNLKGKNQPKHGWATFYGPPLETGLTMLGTMARTVLNTNNPVTTVGRVPPGQPHDQG
jgi:hypothetical protein